jgi:hypothetical protein
MREERGIDGELQTLLLVTIFAVTRGVVPDAAARQEASFAETVVVDVPPREDFRIGVAWARFV